MKAVRCLWLAVCPSAASYEQAYKRLEEIVEKLENGTTVTAELLKKQGIISKIEKDGLKVLGRGELTKKLTVKAAKFTKSAEAAIQAAGGSVEVL